MGLVVWAVACRPLACECAPLAPGAGAAAFRLFVHLNHLSLWENVQHMERNIPAKNAAAFGCCGMRDMQRAPEASNRVGGA